MLRSPFRSLHRYRAIVVLLVYLAPQGVLANEVREQLQLRLEAVEAQAPRDARDSNMEALRRMRLHQF